MIISSRKARSISWLILILRWMLIIKEGKNKINHFLMKWSHIRSSSHLQTSLVALTAISYLVQTLRVKWFQSGSIWSCGCWQLGSSPRGSAPHGEKPGPGPGWGRREAREPRPGHTWVTQFGEYFMMVDCVMEVFICSYTSHQSAEWAAAADDAGFYAGAIIIFMQAPTFTTYYWHNTQYSNASMSHK